MLFWEAQSSLVCVCMCPCVCSLLLDLSWSYFFFHVLIHYGKYILLTYYMADSMFYNIFSSIFHVWFNVHQISSYCWDGRRECGGYVMSTPRSALCPLSFSFLLQVDLRGMHPQLPCFLASGWVWPIESLTGDWREGAGSVALGNLFFYSPCSGIASLYLSAKLTDRLKADFSLWLSLWMLVTMPLLPLQNWGSLGLWLLVLGYLVYSW